MAWNSSGRIRRQIRTGPDIIPVFWLRINWVLEEFKQMPEIYTIFITEKDAYDIGRWLFDPQENR